MRARPRSPTILDVSMLSRSSRHCSVVVTGLLPFLTMCFWRPMELAPRQVSAVGVARRKRPPGRDILWLLQQRPSHGKDAFQVKHSTRSGRICPWPKNQKCPTPPRPAFVLAGSCRAGVRQPASPRPGPAAGQDHSLCRRVPGPRPGHASGTRPRHQPVDLAAQVVSALPRVGSWNWLPVVCWKSAKSILPAQHNPQFWGGTPPCRPPPPPESRRQHGPGSPGRPCWRPQARPSH